MKNWIAGLTLAYWLHHHGLQPTIVEQAPHLRPEGYAIDFAGSGWDVAERMHLILALHQHQTTARYFLFKDRAGHTLARLEVADILEAMRALEGQAGISDLAVFGSGLHVTVPDPSGIARVRDLLQSRGIEIRRLEPIEPSMEDVFVAMIEDEDRKAA